MLLASACGFAQQAPPVTAASLQQLLNQDRLLEFSDQLGAAANLSTEEHLYFLGMLAFHVGRFEDAVKPLVAAVNTHNSSLTPN